MQRRIFYLLFPIAGVLLFQSAQAQSIVFPPGPIVFPPGTATGTVTAGTYAGNINLDGTGIPTQPLSLTLESGVIVNRPSGNAVNAANITLQGPGNTPPSASVTITATDTTITNLATPSGNNQSGLRIQSSGAATITATNTNIDLNGSSGNNGIWAIVQGLNAPPQSPVNATVTWTGNHITNSSNGSNSTGIQAENRGFGNAFVEASGNISVSVGTPGLFTLLGIKAGTVPR